MTPEHAYDYALRQEARRAVARSLMTKIAAAHDRMPWSGIVLKSIDKTAIDFARIEWPKFYSDATHNGFIESWDTLFRSGRCSNWIERSFAPTYLRGGILLPTLACAEEYAKLLGCARVLIKDPVDPARVPTIRLRPA